MSRALLLSIALAALLGSSSHAFQTCHSPLACSRTSSSLSYSNWDAFESRDSLELMIGGSRYEMVELPDSMMSTTLWVGNLCEVRRKSLLTVIF